MIWFEDKIRSQNTKECPTCHSKDIWCTGGLTNDICNERFTSYMCNKCETKWYVEIIKRIEEIEAGKTN